MTIFKCFKHAAHECFEAHNYTSQIKKNKNKKNGGWVSKRKCSRTMVDTFGGAK
jgi:hypothetical protein